MRDTSANIIEIMSPGTIEYAGTRHDAATWLTTGWRSRLLGTTEKPTLSGRLFCLGVQRYCSLRANNLRC